METRQTPKTCHKLKDFQPLSARSAKAAKVSKAAVAYQDSPNGDRNYANCRLFTGPASCKQVEGNVSPNGWCRIWAKLG
jgi:hypothetical protein